MKITSLSSIRRAAMVLLLAVIPHDRLAADAMIGVDFAGGNVHNTPTLLDRADVAGAIPQANWNNFTLDTVERALRRDDSPNATAITLSYSTSEMYGSGTFSFAAGTVDPDSRLLNGYLNALDNEINIVTYTSPGPLVEEFRLGETFASVAPVAVPTLDIAIVESNVRVSWSPELPGFTL